jgi:tetratricopeptide (TPR) repeat protein
MTFDLYSTVFGQLRLLVVNSEGKPIPGVKVTLEDTQISNLTFKLVTNKKGLIFKTGLQNHVFLVTFEKENYLTIQKKIQIPAGRLREEKITLLTTGEAMIEQVASDPHSQAVSEFHRAASFIKEEKYDEALEALKKSISFDDNIYQSHYFKGVVYYEMGKYKEAIEPLMKVIALQDDYAEAYRLLAAVYEKLGNKQESDKYTKLAQEKGGKTAVEAYNEGISAFNAGDIDTSIKAFEEAVKLDDTFAEAYYQLGLNYLNKGLNDKAIACFKKYLELKPDGTDADTAKSIIETLK